MTLNDLIEQVRVGELTVSGAVDVIDTEGGGLIYAIKYFSPQSEAELPYWDLLEEWRSRHPKPTRVQPTTVEAIPEKTGQLWEPCERCGAEPCYMPLHLCSTCWPE